MRTGDFFNRIGFTPNEKKVVIFLLITLCIGGGIKLFRTSSGDAPASGFDYASMDDEFRAKSQALASADSARALRSAASARRMTEGSRRTEKNLTPDGSLDINAATKEALMRLPGIGPATAEAIVSYREHHGGFATNEELLNVRGIGSKKYLKLKPYLREL